MTTRVNIRNKASNKCDHVHILMNALKRIGYDENSACDIMGLKPSHEPQGMSNCFLSFLTCLRMLVENTQDPLVLLRLGQQVKCSDFGDLGNLFRHSRTVHDAIQFGCQYFRLYPDHIHNHYNMNRHAPAYHLDISRGTQRTDNQYLAEFYISTIIKLIDDITDGLSPGPIREAHFKHTLALPEQAQAILKVPIHQQSINSLYFNPEQIHRTLPAYNSDVGKFFLSTFIGNHSQPRSNLVKEYIADNIKRPVTAETAAARMGMSASSLQRQLRSESTSFKQLYDQIRYEKAIDMLSNPDISVKATAYSLGYSSPNSFNRAFQRYTGCTPQAYRQKLYGAITQDKSSMDIDIR